MHKRILGTLTRKASTSSDRSIPNGDSPEATAARGVRLFCESGGPQNTGDEVLHLPTIVEAAESSPAAASQAATEIRKFLSVKNYARAYVQYNAIMLMRILTDNPGKSFTRNLDGKFLVTVKDLLREGKDISVQQILRETLEFFERTKPNDETLAPLRDLWQKEKAKVNYRASINNQHSPYASPLNSHYQQQQQQQQNYFARSHKPKGLPTQAELAQRVEEAKTSAKLLTQLTQSTPPNEVLNNDLLKEFADRCASASRSMQSYINSDSPAPDEDTLLTLIETNDALAGAMSRHQRAVLQARKVASPQPSLDRFSPPPQQPSGGGGIFNNPPPSHSQEKQPQSGPHSIFNRASDSLRHLPPQSQPPPPTGGIGGIGGPAVARENSGFYEAPSLPPPTNGVDNSKPKTLDPFADTNEAPPPGNMQAPLIPQNFGLPPDSMPVPGSPKGDSGAFERTMREGQVGGLGGGNTGESGKEKGVDRNIAPPEESSSWSNLPTSQTATVQPRGAAPTLQAPKPRYRF